MCRCAGVLQAHEPGGTAGLHRMLSPLDELQYWADLSSAAGAGSAFPTTGLGD